jgi:hypothetical protein
MKAIILLTALCWAITSNAQQTTPQVIATSGNVSQQSNAIISYTVGEPVIQTATDGTTILTQGYQQPHYNITLIPQEQNTTPNITVFPNPTTDRLQLSFDIEKETKVIISLYDAVGRQLQNQSYQALPKATLSLNMQQIAAGKYMLTIDLPESSSQKTFEIIKNK